MLTPSPESFADDGCRRLGPYKRGRVFVPMVDVGLDVADEPSNRVERSSAYGLPRQDAEPRLDHVQPRGTGRREVEANVRVLFEPALHVRGEMSRRVIEDDVQLLPTVVASEHLEEPEEVRARVTLRALTDDLPGRDLECRVQARQTMAPIVVSLSCGKTRTKRKHGLSPLERLDLGLLVK